MQHIKNFYKLKSKYKVSAIAEFLNKEGFKPKLARRWTSQGVSNSIHHKSKHPDFVDGINKMYRDGIKPIA